MCLADEKYDHWMGEFLNKCCPCFLDKRANGTHCPLLKESIRPFVEPEFETIHSKAHQSPSQGSQEQCPCQNLTEVEDCTLYTNMKARIQLLYDKWAGSAHQLATVNGTHASKHREEAFRELGVQSSSEWGREAARGEKEMETKGSTLPILPS
jgi:hypothetical protein